MRKTKENRKFREKKTCWNQEQIRCYCKECSKEWKSSSKTACGLAKGRTAYFRCEMLRCDVSFQDWGLQNWLPLLQRIGGLSSTACLSQCKDWGSGIHLTPLRCPHPAGDKRLPLHAVERIGVTELCVKILLKCCYSQLPSARAGVNEPLLNIYFLSLKHN